MERRRQGQNELGPLRQLPSDRLRGEILDPPPLTERDLVGRLHRYARQVREMGEVMADGTDAIRGLGAEVERLTALAARLEDEARDLRRQRAVLLVLAVVLAASLVILY